jgi:hypothetical protein
MGVDAQLLLVSSTRDARNSFEVVVASGRSVSTTSRMMLGGLEFQVLLISA